MKQGAYLVPAWLALCYCCDARVQQHTGATADIAPSVPLASQFDHSSADPVPPSRVFRIHVVDSRNGSHITGARVQLWYDEPSGPGYIVATGPNGEAPMPSPVGEPVRILVSLNGYTDCRKPDPPAAPVGYNLAAIADKGMTAQNTCSRIAVRPTPGELVLYARPPHWYEQLNKNPS